MCKQRYKVFGMVTNMDWEGGRLICWQRERGGKSEQDEKIQAIFKAIRQLMTLPEKPTKRIGFRVKESRAAIADFSEVAMADRQ